MLISNSSTLILLAKATMLSKFLDTVKSITITNAVYKEILHKDSFENLIIKKETEEGRIKIETIQEKYYLSIIKQFKIDEGEASAFALYQNKKYTGILTDDRELIKLCKIHNIKFTTAMSIVVLLFKSKIINKNTALDKLERLQGYGRYSNEIYNYFKAKVR